MKFTQSFAGATLLKATLSGAGDRVTAYGAEQNDERRVAVINKTETAVRLELPSRVGTRAMRLTGPSLASEEGTILEEVRVIRGRTVDVPSHTAMLYEL